MDKNETYEEFCKKHSTAELFIDALLKGQIECRPNYELLPGGDLIITGFDYIFVG